jgi:hypothetical protein
MPQVLRGFVGPVAGEIDCKVALPRAAGSVEHAEAFDDQCAVEERFRRPRCDAQRVVGGGKCARQFVCPLLADRERVARGSEVIPRIDIIWRLVYRRLERRRAVVVAADDEVRDADVAAGGGARVVLLCFDECGGGAAQFEAWRV